MIRRRTYTSGDHVLGNERRRRFSPKINVEHLSPITRIPGKGNGLSFYNRCIRRKLIQGAPGPLGTKALYSCGEFQRRSKWFWNQAKNQGLVVLK